MYSTFTHRFSWRGSRKLTTFQIELFLIIVKDLRRLLKIWQGSWIHFKFSLPFITLYVSQFLLFHFERIFKCKPYRYNWILYQRVFWMCWRQRSMTFHSITVFKSMQKRLSDYGVMAYASKFWNECLKPSDSAYFWEQWWITASKKHLPI